MGRYTTDDPETGLSVRKAVYGRTEQEARAKLLDALAARQSGSLLVSRGRELSGGQYAEHWLAGLRKRPTARARYRQALAHVMGDDRLGNLPLAYSGEAPAATREGSPGGPQRRKVRLAGHDSTSGFVEALPPNTTNKPLVRFS
jgi:hypothetical protein